MSTIDEMCDTLFSVNEINLTTFKQSLRDAYTAEAIEAARAEWQADLESQMSTGGHKCAEAWREKCEAAERERDEARGAMAAQDRREQEAGAKCGVPYEEHGCDWPDAVAEVVLTLRARIAELDARPDPLTYLLAALGEYQKATGKVSTYIHLQEDGCGMLMWNNATLAEWDAIDEAAAAIRAAIPAKKEPTPEEAATKLREALRFHINRDELLPMVETLAAAKKGGGK